ncbi:MAG: hypothetical protein ACP5GX_03225 [Anaerolineae bacterium]
MMRRWYIFVLIGLLVFTACKGPLVSTSPMESPLVPEAVDEVSPIAAPTETPTEIPATLPTPQPQVLKAAEDLLADLKPLVADDLGLKAEELTLVAAERVEWRDASLGCPQPGKLYAQVITPGWRFIFEEEGPGRRHEVHTSEDARDYVICGAGKENPTEPSPMPVDELPEKIERAAKALVEDQMGVPVGRQEVVSVETVQWPDSCLGCASPETICLKVITPGYRIVLRAGDAHFEVHADRAGRSLVLCEGVGGPVAPQPHTTVPEEIWLLHKAVLTWLMDSYPGFGLEQLPAQWSAWIAGSDADSHTDYRFRNGPWEVHMACPLGDTAGAVCVVALHHEGLLWQGSVSFEGKVTEAGPRPEFAYEVGECDKSIPPDDLQSWAGVEVKPTPEGFRFTQRIPYVCCAEIVASLGGEPEERVLRIVETNIGEVCRCMCGYELVGEVSGLKSGSYTVEFWGVQKEDVHPLSLMEQVEVKIP